MSARKPIDSILPFAVAVVLVIGGLLLVRNMLKLKDREEDLARLALMRTQQTLRVKLDALFHEWSEDLYEEAAAIQTVDTVSDARILDRWLPLIRSHWSILSVRMADERGNETALNRADTTLMLSHTYEGSKTRIPDTRLLRADGSTDSTFLNWSISETYDPRERIWFSKALENDRDEPVWSLRQFGDTNSTVLQVSLLLHSRSMNAPYRVLLFDVDPTRSNILDSRSSSVRDHRILFWTSEGRSLMTDTIRNDLDAVEAERLVWNEWMANKSKRSFAMEVNGRRFRASVEQFPLNGLALNSGILIDMGPLHSWNDFERTTLWTMAIVLFILTVLLFILWRRKRQLEVHDRKQHKRNRQQSRKLEKVIGEREVLSREVHHRVKNNLQVVSSLLNLQASTLDDGPVREEFLRGKRRIDEIALVHHKLYGLADLRNVDLKIFFKQLVEAMSDLHKPQSGTISTSVETNGIFSDQDTAIELGIILCELVANCYQHAFPYATGGHIDIVTTNVEGDLHRLLVHNNGVGLPDGYSSGPGKLGLEIVDALSGQLDGSFHVRANGGVTFEVLFRMQRGSRSTDALFIDSEGLE